MIVDDQTLGGTVAVGTMSVAAGVIVTLTEDVVIDASGPVTIAGTVTGDCMALEINGQDAITVSGTLNTACVATVDGGENAPGVTITTPGPISMDGAIMVVSSGPITIRSVATAARTSAAAGSSQLTSGIDLSGSSHIANPSALGQAAPGSDPLAAPTGANMFFESDGIMNLNGTVIEAQDGGLGLSALQTSAEFIEVGGGNGGGGGWVFIPTFGVGIIDIGTSRGLTRIEAGDGGPGGPATATTTENGALARGPGATARGGTGGAGGTVNLDGIGAVPVGADNSLIQRKVGIGGRGGNATATAADGGINSELDVVCSDRDAVVPLHSGPEVDRPFSFRVLPYAGPGIRRLAKGLFFRLSP